MLYSSGIPSVALDSCDESFGLVTPVPEAEDFVAGVICAGVCLLVVFGRTPPAYNEPKGSLTLRICAAEGTLRDLLSDWCILLLRDLDLERRAGD